MRKIVVIGEILVEIMAVEPGDGFRAPIALEGPFPSGAPAIFIDQVARLGHPCAIVSMVGEDDFARVNLDRLAADGVDITGIGVHPDRPTGSAFVRYRPDGSRDFVYNIRHSACGFLPDAATMRPVLDGAGHFHVMGSSLSSPDFVRLNIEMAEAVKARGGTVSFDPNLRKELLDAPGMREAMKVILSRTDLFLPSGDELTLLTDATDEGAAVAELLDRGIRAIVHKRGSDGVTYHDADGPRTAPSFVVEETDPTGAGDCFGGAFVALWLGLAEGGGDIDEALTLACAAGARAVTRRGPMEGASTRAELDDFISRTERRSA